jgi:hypothetical protein
MHAEKIPYSIFDTLFRLIETQPWLKYKRTALVDLYNLCDTKSQQQLIVELITRFEFVDENKTREMVTDIKNVIENVWDCRWDNSYLISIADVRDNGIDGSVAGAQLLKNKFDEWGERNFFRSIGVGAHNIPDNSNAILFDDFIGSGTTIKGKIEYFRRIITQRGLQNITLYVLAFGCMEQAYNSLLNFGPNIYAKFILKKGISDNYLGLSRIDKVSDMILLEKKLSQKYKRYKLGYYNFGYKKTEALYSFQDYNVPNNVFPIFWWPQLMNKQNRNLLVRRAL